MEDISLLWFEQGRFCAEFTTAGTIRNLLDNSVFTTFEFAKAHAFFRGNILVNDYISATKVCKPWCEFVSVFEQTHEDYFIVDYICGNDELLGLEPSRLCLERNPGDPASPERIDSSGYDTD